MRISIDDGFTVLEARRLAALLVATVILLATFLTASVSAAPRGAFIVGDSAPGVTGGLFDEARGAAVNDSTGDVYVADGANHRVQRLSADGTFELAWGWNVIVDGGTGDLGDAFEVCTDAEDCQAGDPGTATSGEPGRLGSPSGVAIDPTDGSVYVWNQSKRRIDKFSADGVWALAFGDGVNTGTSGNLDLCTNAGAPTDVCAVGIAGAGPGQLGATFRDPGLAVDPSGAHVFVADPGNRRIDQFEADGDFIRAWGWDVVPGGGAGFEICDVSCGVGAGLVGFELGPIHIATGPDGTVYSPPLMLEKGEIFRFDSAASSAEDLFLQSIADPQLAVSGLDVDNVSNRLLALAPGTDGIVEFDADTLAVVSSHMANSLPISDGFAVNSVSKEEYVVADTFVLALDETGAPTANAPSAPIVSSIGAHSAQLDSSAVPGGPTGFPATARFEITEDGVTWSPVGSPVDLGTGGGSVPVSQLVTGLEANEQYQVRMVVTKPYGTPTAVTPAAPFDTPVVAPDAETGGAQFISARSAQVIARVNPNNLATTYRFDYGETTSYGIGSVPIPAGSVGDQGEEKTVLQLISGLDPETTYHYRVVATNSAGTTEGSDQQFVTRPPPDAVFPDRGLEMVTPADKGSRRTLPDLAVEMPNVGVPSPDGESLIYGVHFGILDGNSGVLFPHTSDWAVMRRNSTGWATDPLMNLASPISGIGSLFNMVGVSANFNVQAWQQKAYSFQSKSTLGTRVFGDTGGEGGTGWYDWLVDPAIIATVANSDSDAALIDDEGERMLRWSGVAGYQGLLGPSDPSSSLEEGADAIYLQAPPGSGTRDLVNECAGTVVPDSQDISLDATGGTFTLTFDGQTTAAIAWNAGEATVRLRLESLSNVAPGDVSVVRHAAGHWTVDFGGAFAGTDAPEMTGNGSALTGGTGTVTIATLSEGEPGSATLIPTRLGDGTIGEQPCSPGRMTDARGAVGGGGNITNPGGGSTRTAMSDDGARIFFTSPDPAMAPGQQACTTDTGANTACPAQTFVRQYDSSGDALVRWVSRSEVENQEAGLLAQTGFEGASSDGRVVFFKTKAPLTEDDPNGGAQVPGGVTTGTASDDSWDLYRYELPGDRETDPAGGTLTRVSGGPDGEFDPNVHTGDGAAGALRYLSDDGERAYFVTRGIIGDTGNSWNQTAEGGDTSPSGNETTTSTRNLYLYDASRTGDDRWQFIAQLPTTGHRANACAGLNSPSGMSQDFDVQFTASGPNVRTVRTGNNCVHGTPDGRTVVLESAGQLTGGDNDAASDIFVYDADRDDLVRISSPIEDSTSYVCSQSGDRCNGDLGFQFPGSPTSDKIGLNGGQNVNLAVYGPGMPAAGAVSVFFETRAALAPTDVDGNKMDVYEWQAGGISLVTPADSNDDDAFFSGNSRDGEDVFFMTSQRIDPREIDEDVDVYDARVGGGFPYTPPSPGCDPHADACQGTGQDADNLSPNSDVELKDENAREMRISLSVKRPAASARKRAARSGVLLIPVRSDGAGRAKAVARARLGGKLRRVGGGSVRFGKAGRKVLRIELSTAARKRLRSGNALSVRVTVGMTGAELQSVSVRLRRAGR